MQRIPRLDRVSVASERGSRLKILAFASFEARLKVF